MSIDTAIVAFSLWFAFAVRFEELWPSYLEGRTALIPLAIIVALPVFYGLGFYRSLVQYMSERSFYGILQGVSVSVLGTIAIWVLAQGPTVPRSVWVVFWIVATLLISASRLVAQSILQVHHGRVQSGEPVAIYGAGEAGAQLALALRHSREYRPIAFLDEQRELRGSEIFGVKIYAPRKLPKLIARFKISTVLLALPSVSRGRRNEIIRSLEPLPVRVMAVPSLIELMTGSKHVDDVREVDLEDILGRDSVAPIESLLSACVKGKSVMVTGGGGSIGSELCRQIIQQCPRCLVVYEMSEYTLYRIEHELRRLMKRLDLQVELVTILGSVVDRNSVQSVMETFRVQTVYHAAAYKHVPIVEHNPVQGVQNNVLGTYNTAIAALEAGVETFVLISTDKAVRPTNVMGATKRFAELMLQALAQRSPITRFCIVRFGNVLASSGSVVPVFREQIRKGGPVTVTHPNISRYFMTIPEAGQLVIQAGAMAEGGDVFVLDMGESVRIVDLARRMIHLSGFEVRDDANPHGDIEIRFTGLRPGEKLYEELLIGEKDLPTAHPMIRRAQEDALPWNQVLEFVRKFEQAVDALDYLGLRQLLLASVNGYRPSDQTAPLWPAQAAIQRTQTIARAIS